MIVYVTDPKKKKGNASWVINPAGIKLFCGRYCESFY